MLRFDGFENFDPCIKADSNASFPHDFNSCTVDLGLLCCSCDGSLQDFRARMSLVCKQGGMIRVRSAYRGSISHGFNVWNAGATGGTAHQRSLHVF